MIREPSNYAANQIDRLTGRVTLALPPVFKAELDAAIERGLARLPGKGREEIKRLVSAQVALTLRATDFSSVMEAEAARQIHADQVAAKVRKIEWLRFLRRKHAGIVQGLEKVIFNHRSSPRKVALAEQDFFHALELLDETESEPLRNWAEQIIEKHQKIRGIK